LATPENQHVVLAPFGSKKMYWLLQNGRQWSVTGGYVRLWNVLYSSNISSWAYFYFETKVDI